MKNHLRKAVTMRFRCLPMLWICEHHMLWLMRLKNIEKTIHIVMRGDDLQQKLIRMGSQNGQCRAPDGAGRSEDCNPSCHTIGHAVK